PRERQQRGPALHLPRFRWTRSDAPRVHADLHDVCAARTPDRDARPRRGRWRAVHARRAASPRCGRSSAPRCRLLLVPEQSDRRIAALYEAARLPYNVGALTQLVAGRIAGDDAALGERVSCITRERGRVAHELHRLPELEAFPSAANFILFRHRTVAATALHAALLARGVLVRDVSSWPDAGESLRATIGSPAENDRLLDALRGILAERGR